MVHAADCSASVSRMQAATQEPSTVTSSMPLLGDEIFAGQDIFAASRYGSYGRNSDLLERCSS
jgi:hypothetical protein